jgi:hypothetical protein
MTAPIAFDSRYASVVFNPQRDEGSRVHCDPLAEDGLWMFSESGLIVWGEHLRGGRGQLAPAVAGKCFVVKGPASVKSLTVAGVPYLDLSLETKDGPVREMRIPAVDVIMIASLDDAEAGSELVSEELAARKRCIH